jgi:hypothetical protein
MSHFKGKKGFTAVGVGPLSIDDAFVHKGAPLHQLKGDDHFLAK